MSSEIRHGWRSSLAELIFFCLVTFFEHKENHPIVFNVDGEKLRRPGMFSFRTDATSGREGRGICWQKEEAAAWMIR